MQIPRRLSGGLEDLLQVCIILIVQSYAAVLKGFLPSQENQA